jgi:hypothetical protein
MVISYNFEAVLNKDFVFTELNLSGGNVSFANKSCLVEEKDTCKVPRLSLQIYG